MSTQTNMRNAARIISLVAAVLLLTAIAAFVIDSQKVIPVTGGREVSVERDQNQSIYIGSGYTLKMDKQGVKIIAPANLVKPARARVETQKIDVGAGYTLVLNDEGGRIVPPISPAIVLNRLDIGSGYTLQTDTEKTLIVAPVVPSYKKAVTPSRVDIGSGYWIEVDQEGGQITSDQ